MGSMTKYSGVVSFNGWEWPSHNVLYTPDQFAFSIQEGFNQTDLNHFMFSEDGKSVRFILDCLNGGDIPTFSASISDMVDWALEDHKEKFSEDKKDITPLLDELKRCVALIENEMGNPTPTDV